MSSPNSRSKDQSPFFIYSVTEVISCPYFHRNKLVDPKFEFAFKRGTEAHQQVEEFLKSKGCEVEVPIEYRFSTPYGDVKIVGVMDAVDFENRRIYEIKSRYLKVSYMNQLLLYRDMLYYTYGAVYQHI